MIRSAGGCGENGRGPNALTGAAFGSLGPRDSLHPLSSAEATLFSGGRFPAGNERISRKDVAQELVGCFADADARRGYDLSCAKAVVSNPHARMVRGKIASVVALTGDAERFRQTAGPAGESYKIAGALQRDLSSPRHLFDALKRFERAEK